MENIAVKKVELGRKQDRLSQVFNSLFLYAKVC